MLFDGRVMAQNGWFVARVYFRLEKQGKVLTWTVEPNADLKSSNISASYKLFMLNACAIFVNCVKLKMI
jgi:hypothetical protein